MITFSRVGTTVQAAIGTDLRVDRPVLLFSWEANGEVFAELLREHLTKQLSNALKVARLDAYSQGWRDAKSKRKRETWFQGWF